MVQNQNMASEGELTEYLRNILELNLPKGSKKKKIVLGVQDKGLGTSIKAAFSGVECETADTSEVVGDMLRGLRLHGAKLLKVRSPDYQLRPLLVEQLFHQQGSHLSKHPKLTRCSRPGYSRSRHRSSSTRTGSCLLSRQGQVLRSKE